MKNLSNEKKIIKWIILLPIVGVIITSFILTNIFITSKQETHKLEISGIKKNYILNLKEKIKERIEHLSYLLNSNYNNQIDESKENIKDVIRLGYAKIEDIYKTNKHLPKEEILKLLNEKMKDIRFFKNNSGYFFIHDIQTAKVISLPSKPELIGKSIATLIDTRGKNVFNSYKEIVTKKGEGFDTWYWNKPGSTKSLEKIGYVKKFAPLNIIIGTAVYVEDIKEKISNNTINFVESLKYEDDSYIFIMDTKGKALVHKNKSIINVPLSNLDENIQKNVVNIINSAKNSNGTFIGYLQSKGLFNKDENQSKKISYIKHIPILDWVIGTGLYTFELEKELQKKHNQLEKLLEESIKTTVFISTLATLIIVIFLIFLSKRIKDLFQFYSKKLEENNLKLLSLNNKLEKEVQEQVAKVRKQDIILNQQSKLVSMGEMLGNIAHQWRQPLSIISTIASGIRVHIELGSKIEKKQLDKDLKLITDNTQLLSNTIDDFRNFYSKNKVKDKFLIKKTINQILNLISANIKNLDIEIILDIEDIEINSYENELIQVILNILKNAKDALKELENEKYIFIETKKDNDFLIIQIYDNAKGIKKNIINRIFEPYFTTKFKSQGTGIGLYMTKNIVESSLKGEISFMNKEFSFKNKKYKGALFTVKLPLS